MTEKSAKELSWVFRVLIAILILLGGRTAFQKLAGKKPKIEIQELPTKRLRLEVKKQSLSDHQIAFKAFARLRSPKELSLTSELAAKVIWISPKLQVGETFQKGEVLFRLDPEDFKIKLSIAQSQVQSEAAQQRMLTSELKSLKKVLPLRQEKLALSNKEYERNKKLLKQNLTTDTQVILKQQAYLQDLERLEEQKKQILGIQEKLIISKSRQEELKNSIRLNQRELNRCEVSSPGNFRLSKKFITEGQFLNRGQNCLTLVDDSRLEVLASLNGPEALRRLELREGQNSLSSRLKQQNVSVKWQGSDKHWQATISGIEEYNSLTRSLNLVIQLEKSAASQLMPGLFCEVSIPAKKISQALRIPYFSYQNGQIRIVEDNLLTYLDAELLYDDGDFVYVRPQGKNKDWQVVNEIMNNAVSGTAVQVIGAQSE